MSGYYDYGDDSVAGNDGNRRLVVIVAVAVLVILAALLAGYLVHRGGTPAAKQRTPALATSPTSQPAATASPTATSTSPLSAPSARAGRPLTANSAGVIVGYSHSQGGAIAAAGNYTASLYVQANRTSGRERTVLTSIAATAADADQMAGDFSSEDTALSKILTVANLQTPGVIAYGHPLGYRASSYSAANATIDVYVAGGQGIAGAASDAPTAGETFYEVDRVQLHWTGDWKLANWSHLVQDNGPELATVAAEGYLPFPIGEAGAA